MSSKLTNFHQYKKVYFIGIKGVGMTALAIFLKESGISVSGSDIDEVFLTDDILLKHNIHIKEGFKKENVPHKVDLVIVTGAHGGLSNIEAVEAKRKGITTLMHGQALGMVMNNFFGISVSGCHGKTTTSAMIATVLKKAGLDPSYAVGCISIKNLGAGGHRGKGNYFVAEADEYATDPNTDKTPRFFWQDPKILVINNIEFDHPDVYENLNSVTHAFASFAKKVPTDGLIVAGIDNRQVQKLLTDLNPIKHVATFGFSPQADYQVTDLGISNQKTIFKIKYQNLIIGDFILNLPGRHNILNATASFIVSNFLGLQYQKIKEGLKSFSGTKRRFEKIKDLENGISLYDDYAHHPTEIVATLKAAKEWFINRRIIIIFQPHTFSRTKVLFKEFSKAFAQTPNISLITDIFPSAREAVDKSINSAMLTQEILLYKKEAVYLPSKSDVLDYLQSHTKENDVIITMGAGDIYLWHKDIIKKLSDKNG